jgi:hypothetical protein
MTEFIHNILIPSLVNGSVGTVGAVIALIIFNLVRAH